MKKKAQIKFGETFGVIFIVYIIVVIGFMWYNNINTKDIEKLKNNDLQERAYEKYYYLANLDIIHVSEKGIIDKEYDINSLKTLSIYTQSEYGKEQLRKQLGESTVILKIFDNTDELKKLNPKEILILYNNTPKNEEKIIEKVPFKTLIPVKTNDKKNKIGILEILVYIRE